MKRKDEMKINHSTECNCRYQSNYKIKPNKHKINRLYDHKRVRLFTLYVSIIFIILPKVRKFNISFYLFEFLCNSLSSNSFNHFSFNFFIFTFCKITFIIFVWLFLANDYFARYLQMWEPDGTN